MKLELKDLLIEPFYFNIDRRGRNKVFKNLELNNKEISKKVGCSSTSINYFKNLNRFVRFDILKGLLNLAKIKEENFEKYVLSIRRGCGINIPLKIKLPIKPSPELSLIIGKGLGDGGVSSDHRFFYTNNQRGLIDEVIEYIRVSIGETRYNLHYRKKNNCYEIKFSSSVGFIIHFFGVPKGRKIIQKYDIPSWIKEGNKEIKKKFIRGLFDDESCVRNERRYRSIIIGLGKDIRYKNSLKQFLDSIKILLKEFEIDSGKICVQKEYENRTILRFSIYNLQNLTRYRDKIGFTHKEKLQRLEKNLPIIGNLKV